MEPTFLIGSITNEAGGTNLTPIHPVTGVNRTDIGSNRASILSWTVEASFLFIKLPTYKDEVHGEILLAGSMIKIDEIYDKIINSNFYFEIN